MRAKFKSWRRDLALAVWLFFEERSGSNVYRLFPRDVVLHHILPHLRERTVECEICEATIHVPITLWKPLDLCSEDFPIPSCSYADQNPGFRIVKSVQPSQPLHYKTTHGFRVRADHPMSLAADTWADRMLTYDLPPPRAPEPPPPPSFDFAALYPNTAPTPKALRAHFVAEERERERQQRQPYQPAGKGKGRKYQGKRK